MAVPLVLLILSYFACAGEAQVLQVFGDSLSDAGINGPGGGFAKWVQLVLQTSEVFPEPPYYQGTYSNGPVWVTQAASLLQIKYFDWAAGGATSGAGLSQQGPLPAGFAGYPMPVTVLAPNLFQQVDQFFQSTNNTANSSDVYVIFIGNNDFFSIISDGKNVTAEEVVGNIESAMEILYDAGARQFILFTLPPLTVLPTSYLSNMNFVTQWLDFNPQLMALSSMFGQMHPDSSVNIFDFEAFIINAFLNAAQYGISSGATPCYPTPEAGLADPSLKVCSNPSNYFFWDNVHPTTVSHSLIAHSFAHQFGYLWGETISPAPSIAPASMAVTNSG